MARLHTAPPTDHLAAARAQDEDTYWVFLYDLKTRRLVAGAAVMTFGGSAELQSVYADDPALMPLLLDLAATNCSHTVAPGVAPLKPGAFKARHAVGFKDLFDRTVNRAKLPLHAWRELVEEASAEESAYGDED
jgi:hypothetical protein